MIPPLLVDAAPFSSPVAYTATAGIYSTVWLPTLAEVRERRRAKRECTCVDGTCHACFLAEDAAFERSQDA